MKKYWIIGGSIAAVSAIYGVFYFSRRNRIVRRAKFFEDVQEIGDNQSFADQTFQDMLATAGWKSGEEWCMYFAKAVYLKALPNQSENINKMTGSTQGSFNSVKNGKVPNFTIITSGRPRRGDIAIWQNKANPSKGHAGVVIKTTSKEFPSGFTTIEGNTEANADFYGSGQSVRIVEHNLDYGQTAKSYPSKTLRGFIRFKPFYF